MVIPLDPCLDKATFLFKMPPILHTLVLFWFGFCFVLFCFVFGPLREKGQNEGSLPFSL